MVHVGRCWLAGTGAVLLSLNTVQAQFVPGDLIVRVYNTAALPHGDVVAAQRTADRIFNRARIRVRWRECQTASGPAAAAEDMCADRLQPREVMARLAAAGRGALPSESIFGYAVVDRESQMGTLATIFADRITEASFRLRVARSSLLGRMLAHEVGHLLLGSNSHAARGLMRAWWNGVDVRRARKSDWQFSDEETRRMNAVLTLRAADTIDAGIDAGPAPQPRPRT